MWSYKPESVARAELHQFVYRFEPRVDRIPARIDPMLAQQFVREQLGDGKPPLDVCRQLGELADYHDCFGVVPELLDLLVWTEEPLGAFLASIVVTRVIWVLGDKEQQNAGWSYYEEHMLRTAHAVTRMRDLVLGCYVEYAVGGGAGVVARRIDEIVAMISAGRRPGAAPTTAALELRDLRNMVVPRIEKANALKQQILGVAAPIARLEHLVAIYLGFDQRYLEFTERWAARLLLRASRASGRDQLIQVFRAAIERLGTEPLGPQARLARWARALHALEFLGEPLSSHERAGMQPSRKRFDLLSID